MALSQGWNRGAERVFGYSAEEAIGQPITIIIPSDRQDEERAILTRIRRGERIEHFTYSITSSTASSLLRPRPCLARWDSAQNGRVAREQ